MEGIRLAEEGGMRAWKRAGNRRVSFKGKPGRYVHSASTLAAIKAAAACFCWAETRSDLCQRLGVRSKSY
eukprot:1149058-Pelagomonas_calceolata.AAC.7